MAFSAVSPGVWRGALDLEVGALAKLWREFGADVIVGHPTFNNTETIGRQLAEGIGGAAKNFPGQRVSFVVSDGTYSSGSTEASTIEAALAGAREALDRLDAAHRELVQVVVTPYDGYGGDRTPGKGSALKLIFDEMATARRSC